MSSVPFGDPHILPPMSQRLRHVAFSLDLFAVAAFLTDPCNRFLWVNHPFARMVGDPIRDRLPAGGLCQPRCLGHTARAALRPNPKSCSACRASPTKWKRRGWLQEPWVLCTRCWRAMSPCVGA